MSNEFRYEIKFVLNEAALASFLSWMYLNTNCRKKYAKRTVNSIYFDDLSYSSVRDNLSGVPNRQKTRLRWYQNGNNNPISIPVLEQKTRIGRLGSKSSVAINSLKEIIYSSTFSTMMDLIRNEVSLDHYATLEYLIPTLNVSYSRQYFEDNNGLRITVDDAIKFNGRFSLHQKLNNTEQIDYRSKIVELKFEPEMKNYVVDLMRPLSLTPVRHSKYLTGLAMFGQVQYL
jgi:hypothetical protein